MKKAISLLLILLSVEAVSQHPADSIQALLKTASDTTKIRLLKELCWENRYSNPPEALRFGLEGLSLSRQVNSYVDESEIGNFLGIIQRNVGDNAGALEYFLASKHLAEKYGIDRELAYSLNNIGDIYNLEKKYREALENEMEALEIFETLPDSVGISYCCHQIALSYKNLTEYARALEYDRRAMKIRELLGNRAGVAYSLISIGEDYLKMDREADALENLLKSREIFTELDDRFGLATSLYSIGMHYKTLHDNEAAIKYLTESLELGRETDSPMAVRNAAGVLSELYAGGGDFRDAYQMHILYKNTYDSLYIEENLVKITQLAMQHEFEQKEILQLAEIARQKQFRNYLIISIVLVIILIVVIFSRYRVKRNANIKLQKQNEEIEAQKKKLESLFVSLRIKNDELSQQNEEIEAQKDHLMVLNRKLESQTFELNRTLTELTQAESQLVQSEKMASLGLLTAGVAHELNNPINFMSTSISPLRRNIQDLLALLEKFDAFIKENKTSDGYREIREMKKELDMDYLVKEIRSLLEGISEGASRAGQIVKDLRTFSRMDENEFINVDIHEGLNSTLSLLGSRMEDRITVHRDYGTFPNIKCLPGKLNQVFMNILTNSILAIEGKGDIYIKTSSSGQELRISIRDTGKGMTPEVREHIFEPFFTTRGVGEGTGLGLSISYSIIEEHKGSIEVSSEPGKGTEFIIKLPVDLDS